MCKTFVFIVSFTISFCVCGSVDISDEAYELLPPIFHIDRYSQCIEEKKLFCRVSLKLSPLNKNNTTLTWTLIRKTQKSDRHYNHDELFHAICVNTNSTDDADLKRYISQIYTDNYKNLGLKATVTNANCSSNQHRTKLYDILLLSVFGAYLLLTVFATLHNAKRDTTSKYLLVFSVHHNIQKLRRTYDNSQFQKLKCIEALRFYTTIYIILCHTFCSFAGGYVKNTKYLEDFSENPIRHVLRNSFLFLVQKFFLISAWLLAYHSFQVFEAEGINSVKFVLVTFFNRYLRILPPMLFMVCLGRSVWVYGAIRGPVKDIYFDKEYQRCQDNWWINFLFVNNHYRKHEICYFTTWYLAADTQLYVLSLILISVISKTRFKILSLVVCTVVAVAVPTVVSYINRLDFTFRITPEHAKYHIFHTYEFHAIYTATYANLATYMLGLLFGYLHYRLENRLYLKNKLVVSLWWFAAFATPIIVLIVSTYKCDRITSALLAGVVKPLYALGFGLGILAISQNTGGIIKRFFEWKPAIFLGNFTYSTYVVHLGIVFYRTATATEPMQISDGVLFVSFVQDVILSQVFGFLLYLFVEMPARQLQTLLVPKYRIRVTETKPKGH